MLRNLLDEFGRSRSILVTAMAPPAGGIPEIMHADGSVVFDPEVFRSGGSAPTWYFGDGDDDTTDAPSHTYPGGGDYTVTIDVPVPASITKILSGSVGMTELSIPETWINMTQVDFAGNKLTSMGATELPSALSSLAIIGASALTSLTSFTMQAWSALTTLQLFSSTSLTTITTHSGTTLVADIRFQNCTTVETFAVQSTWGALLTLYAWNNNLSFSEIDAMLIELDGIGLSNGNFRYQTNPGSADGGRSGAAATAKANLVTKGWTIVS